MLLGLGSVLFILCNCLAVTFIGVWLWAWRLRKIGTLESAVARASSRSVSQLSGFQNCLEFIFCLGWVAGQIFEVALNYAVVIRIYCLDYKVAFKREQRC